MNLKVEDILKVTKGDLIIGDLKNECTSFSRDTRTIKKNDTYIAIRGENFDGNLFWRNAFEKGADVVIMDKVNLAEEDLVKYKKNRKTIIQVEDTILALGQMATLKRSLYGDKLKVIGITGSVGKTSTKDIIANVLSKKYKVLKTEGNNNNNIGLPLTILRIKDEQIAVIEMGMNHLGEISYLAKIAQPDLAIITNIGTSHIGNLGSRENILKAKLEILEGMKNKEIIVNNDNDLLNKWSIENKQKIKIHTFGIKNKSDVEAEDIKIYENLSEFICKKNKEKFHVKIPEIGEHFILNAICAITVGDLLNMENIQMQEGLKDFKITDKRMEIIKLKNNITLINDSYNASYESVKAALLSLKNMKAKRKIAVFGDMFELGEFAEKLHRKVGEEIIKNKIDKLYLIGKNTIYILDELKKQGYNENNINYFENKKELEKKLEQDLQSGDIVLFKASNGMKLFEVVENVKKYLK